MSRCSVPRTSPTAPGGLTSTSHALLGLLSVRPWTSYELAQQVRRSLNWFWPRAERKLYDEPKRLVAAGLATASEEFTGRRKRTVYEITAAGRRELAAWLGADAASPSWESEAMVKVFFADAGDLDALRHTLSSMEAEASRRLAELAEMAGQVTAFPQRSHLSALTLRLQEEHEAATLRWARWALAQTEEWVSAADPGGWDASTELADLAAAVVPGRLA